MLNIGHCSSFLPPVCSFLYFDLDPTERGGNVGACDGCVESVVLQAHQGRGKLPAAAPSGSPCGIASYKGSTSASSEPPYRGNWYSKSVFMMQSHDAEPDPFEDEVSVVIGIYS